jgi:hypothetical protein
VSQQNVDLVRRGYLGPSPLSGGAEIAPDAEFDFTAIYPDQPVLHGVEQMRVKVHRDRSEALEAMGI